MEMQTNGECAFGARNHRSITEGIFQIDHQDLAKVIESELNIQE
jgi:hypothetical protein